MSIGVGVGIPIEQLGNPAGIGLIVISDENVLGITDENGQYLVDS